MNQDEITFCYGEIPSFLKPFLKSKAMERIDHVGMHCAMEYTSFPFYSQLKKYSRAEHSLGVALLIYRFTKSEKMSLSGLFHDIATPSFAHVIDFLKGDHEKQEATEEKTSEIIRKDETIMTQLKKLSLSLEEVNDYHLYPIADNDSPRLSCDRLEYTLGNFFHYGFASLDEVKEMVNDIKVLKNENGVDEIGFSSFSLAKKFTLLCLKNSEVYTRDEDRYGMEYLARVLKKAIFRGVLKEEDLYGTEEEVIRKLNSDGISKKDFSSFRLLDKVKTEEVPSSLTSFKIPSKKRYINPLLQGKGRIFDLDSEVKEAITSFLEKSFDYYVVKV